MEVPNRISTYGGWKETEVEVVMRPLIRNYSSGGPLLAAKEGVAALRRVSVVAGSVSEAGEDGH